MKNLGYESEPAKKYNEFRIIAANKDCDVKTGLKPISPDWPPDSCSPQLTCAGGPGCIFWASN